MKGEPNVVKMLGWILTGFTPLTTSTGKHLHLGEEPDREESVRACCEAGKVTDTGCRGA